MAPSDQGLMSGRLLKGKMLQLNTNDRKGLLQLQTVGDIEQYLGVVGLVVTLLDTSKNEKLHQEKILLIKLD